MIIYTDVIWPYIKLYIDVISIIMTMRVNLDFVWCWGNPVQLRESIKIQLAIPPFPFLRRLCPKAGRGICTLVSVSLAGNCLT